MQEISKRCGRNIRWLQNGEILIASIVMILLGGYSTLRLFGVEDYLLYHINTDEYCILEGTVTNVEKYFRPRQSYWYTTVYCSETNETYQLSTKHSDQIGEKVIWGHNKSECYKVNVWLKPYIPKEPVTLGTLALIIGLLGFVTVVHDMCIKVKRTKLVYATVLYKKKIQNGSIPKEYAVCVCKDQDGKEYLMKTRNMFGGIDAQVKDELLVAVNPQNYRSYQFLEQNCELIKRSSDSEISEIEQNLDIYIC